ncbi:hypothetical protein LEMLEM_LOCUS5499, partial [Lemmus lemmus]
MIEKTGCVGGHCAGRVLWAVVGTVLGRSCGKGDTVLGGSLEQGWALRWPGEGVSRVGSGPLSDHETCLLLSETLTCPPPHAVLSGSLVKETGDLLAGI